MSLARLTQLFAEGKELVLTPGSGDPVVLWIAKLNAFEEEQANQAGRVARARLINAIREIGTPEWDWLQAQKGDTVSVAMVEAIVQSKESELFVKALNDLRADPDWRERLEIMDQSDEDTLKGIELAAHDKLKAEHAGELLDRHDQRKKDLREELSHLDRPNLEEQYEQAFLNEQGMAAFGLERARQHIYLCMRSCEAGVPDDYPDDNARWDHSACDHQLRYLASPDEVAHLPQSVREKVEDAYNEISLAPSMARFTDALESSSESPERSATEAVSTPSGPAGTSAGPVTT
jgi:hypothetical protein